MLGVPLGGAEFKQAELQVLLLKVAKFCQRVVDLDHPQAAMLLLSKCCGVCRVAHTLKVLHPSVVSDFVFEFDKVMLDTLEQVAGFALDDLKRSQAALPVRLGGLGLQSAVALSPVAFLVASWAFQTQGKEALALPEFGDTETFFPQSELAKVCSLLPGSSVLPRAWLAEGALPEDPKDEWLHQKWWISQVEKQQLEKLVCKSTGRDVVRLQCLSRQASGAWLHAIPSKGLGLEISPALFRTLLKFWFGAPILDEVADGSGAPFVPAPVTSRPLLQED